jgi:DNA-binding response OmpR family regulator
MRRILIAEDEPHILLLIQRMLESAGYAVTSLVSGGEALRSAQKDKPDLMILDIMLPECSGLDVCREVKTSYGEDAPPIILISALGQQLDVEAGLAAGADDYIIKPFSPRMLLERVEKALYR